jgi:hypothetical protein
VPQRVGGAAAALGDATRQHLRLAGGGAEGAPRGLLFLHAGLSSAQGIAWNLERPWMVASVGAAPLSGEGGVGSGAGPPEEASAVQVWSPLALAITQSQGLV